MQAKPKGNLISSARARGVLIHLMLLLAVMQLFTVKLQAQQEQLTVEYYSIPSPEEILDYIHEQEINFTPRLLNCTTKINLYNTSKLRLLAYGFYTANMAYAISFDQTGTAMEFFELTDNMGRQLNLFPPGTDQIIRRLKQNVNNIDSLNLIYDEIYLTVVANLHDTERFGEYALISAGGVVESLFLALNSDGAKLNEENFRIRVWDQKHILDQLVSMIQRHVNPQVRPLILQQMAGLIEAFNEMPQPGAPTTASRLPGGAISVGVGNPGNVKVLPIDRIQSEVNKLRALWVK